METAEQIIAMLGLKRHPTCGFVAETYRSRQQIPRQALPASYEGSRPFGSVLYFMVTPEAQIRLHVSIPTRCITITWVGRWKYCCCIRTELEG